MKTYAAKSSAVRAAKKAGLNEGEFSILQTADGQWVYEAETNYVPTAALAPIEPVVIPEEPTEPEEPAGPVDAEAEKAADAQMVADAAAEAGDAVAESTAKPDNIVRKSSIERPTKKVWDIAEAMFVANPDTRRKDVIAECVRRGIAFYTARTQYQVWSQLQKEAKAAVETK